MKKNKITLLIISLSIFLFRCNKDEISTNSYESKYSYIEYKNYPITCNDSLIKINQCVISSHPKRDSTYFQILITGDYIGKKTILYPTITIKAIGYDGKELFEKHSYLENFINASCSGNSRFTNSYLSIQNQKFVTSTYFLLSEYKNESKFKLSDIKNFEVSKVEFDTYLTSNIESSTIESSPIRLDSLKIDENSITQKFTNIGLKNISFYNKLIGFHMIDNNGIVFEFNLGHLIPVLNYSPNQQGSFVVSDIHYTNVVLKDVIVHFDNEIDTTKTKSILNGDFNKKYNEYQKIKLEKYKLYTSKRKIRERK